MDSPATREILLPFLFEVTDEEESEESEEEFDNEEDDLIFSTSLLS